jgi:hypothetical protein
VTGSAVAVLRPAARLRAAGVSRLDASERLGHAAARAERATVNLLTQHLPAPLRALAFLLIVLLIGRVVLSWLPPGRLGAHVLRELPATLAACFVLDWATSRAFSGLARTLAPPIAHRAFLPLVAVAALARWLTLPATFVPTPPPRVAPARMLLVAIPWACAAVLAVYLSGPLFEANASPNAITHATMIALTYVALPVLLEHALRELEVPAAARLMVWAAPALLLWILPNSLIYTDDVAWTPLLFGVGVAFAVVARIRADRRASAFSAIAFGAMATLAAGWPFATAGLVGLALFGPGASLLERAAWPLASALLFTPWVFTPWALPLLESRPAGSTYFAAVAVPVVLFALPAFFARGWRAARA